MSGLQTNLNKHKKQIVKATAIPQQREIMYGMEKMKMNAL